jgi:TfoX/Sxy family transcriptional regulator of competence genes
MSNELAERIREAVGEDPNVAEIRMFGGICFTLNGNMMVGTMKDGSLLSRVGDDQEAAALSMPGASRMNFTGREMKGFVIVAPETLDDAALKKWIAMASAYVGPMPPKTAKAKKSSLTPFQ